MNLYNKLYQATKEQEDKNDLPLFVGGIFCNTNDGSLDVECVSGGCGLLSDNDDLTEFLEGIGISPEDVEKALQG